MGYVRPVAGRRRRARTVVLGSLLAALLALQPALPAAAVTVRTHDDQRVLGGITSERLEIRGSDGSLARGNILRFQEDDPAVDLRPRLAGNTVAGTEGMLPLARRELSRGAVAGINGGYWLSRPWGAPNGLFVDRGRLLAGQAARNNTGGGPTGRASAGWQQHGPLVMDRLLVDHELALPGTTIPTATIDELNRQPLTTVGVERAAGELLLFTDRFGTPVRVPDQATVVIVEGLTPGSAGTTEGSVVQVRQVDAATSISVPVGQQLLVAYAGRRAELHALAAGAAVEVTTRITPEATDPARWEGLWGSVAGGQLLVREGRRRSVDEWREAAAFSDTHATARQPRTAIARTAGGEVLLVTIDGRQPGWSQGITLRDLADALVSMGVQEAVNLDGGGSTTMTIDGAIHNRPSQSGRSVADGLFLYVEPPAAARTLAAACDQDLQLAGASFLDVPATSTHAAAIGCLSGWGITTGVTTTSYEPATRVTRAQMASFLGRWIDDTAERGSGRALSSDATLGFRDVTPGSAHADAIARLADAGIVVGRSSTRFAPGEPVTRAQTATMVARAIAHVTGQELPAGRDTFVDDNGSTHEGNIDRLAATGVLTGTGGFTFAPSAAVTRGAMASILMRASADLVEAGIAVPPGSGPVVAGQPETEDVAPVAPDDGDAPDGDAPAHVHDDDAPAGDVVFDDPSAVEDGSVFADER